MRKFVMIGAAVAALSLAAPMQAQAEDAGKFVGGTAGAWTGGTIGWFLGGPIGAVIGGWTGAAVGATVLSDRHYRTGTVFGDYRVGDVVDVDIRLRRIDGDDRYGYFESDGYFYVVDRETGEIVEIREG